MLTMDLGFSEVLNSSCGHRFPFDRSKECPVCGTELQAREFGEIDPAAAERVREWRRLIQALTQPVAVPTTEVAEDAAQAWLMGSIASGSAFLEQVRQLTSDISGRSAAPIDDEELVKSAVALRRIADAPFAIELPVAWRLVHSLVKGMAKSLRGVLEALAGALEAPVMADVPPLEADLQAHFDRAGALIANVDLALAGLEARAGVSMGEVIGGLAQADVAATTKRLDAFARHYFGIPADTDLSPDIAVAMAVSAFGIESRPEPDVLQKVARRMWARLARGGPLAYPPPLQEDLVLAAERIENALVVLGVLERELDDIILDEEKARLAARMAEEGLRPLLAVLSLLHEGVDDPARYETLRLSNLAPLMAGLEPRLPAAEKFVARFPIEYRHAYAHGSISNDGTRVFFELIEPPRRLSVTRGEVETTISALADAIVVLAPVLTLAVHLRMPQRPNTTLLPRTMLVQHAGMFMAQFRLEGRATATASDVVVRPTAMPAKPGRLLSMAAGLSTVAADRVLRVEPPGGPNVRIPLTEVPTRSDVLSEVTCARFRLLTEWSHPALSKQAHRSESLDADLVLLLARILRHFSNQVSDGADEAARATLRTEAKAVASCLAARDDLTAYGSRLKEIAEGLASGSPETADLSEFVHQIESVGLLPTTFMGDI